MSSAAGILRHHEQLGDADVVEVDGIRCTSLERTVFDLARSLGWEQAVVCADAGMRVATVHDR